MLTLALYIITVLIWGTTWFAIKFQLTVPLEWSAFYRFAMAAALLMTFNLIRGKSLRYPMRDHLVFAMMGFLLFGTNYYFTYQSTALLPSGLVAVVFTAIGLLNPINAALFQKKKIEPKTWIAGLMGIAGIMLIFWPELKGLEEVADVYWGIGFAFLGAWVASLGNLFANISRNRNLPVIRTTSWAMVYGSFWLLVYALFSGKAMSFDTSTPYVAALLYLSIFGTIVAFSAYILLIGRIGMEKAGYSGIMYPVIALVISSYYENFHWSGFALIGLALTLMGNVVMLKKRKAAVVKPAIS